MTDITITRHALERFVERGKKNGMLIGKDKNPEVMIRKLLERAVPENIKPAHRVKRIINSGFKDARYLVAEGWRFVLSADGNTVLTIERVHRDQN